MGSSENMPHQTGATIDGATGKLIPLPPRPRVLRLATVKEVRLELARLYREAREGKVDQNRTDAQHLDSAQCW
jgi:hypothetical protein